VERISTNDKNLQRNDDYLQPNDDYLQPNDEYLQPSDEYLQPNDEYLQRIVTNLHSTSNLQQPVLSLSANTQRPALPLPADALQPLFSRRSGTQLLASDRHADPDQPSALDDGATSQNAVFTNWLRGKR
jgi:hypothetical protein